MRFFAATAMRTTGIPPSLPLVKYSGLYENDLYGPARVVYEEGVLILHFGQILSALEHLQKDTFRIQTPLPYMGRYPVVFVTKYNGIVDQLRLPGIADFQRVIQK